MLSRDDFRNKQDVKNLLTLIKSASKRQTNIMEVCGTHTMAIAQAGIRQMLPGNIRLISGPGCPVCVTPAERIDDIYYLSKQKNIIITTYGDMVRVPGTQKQISLERSRMEGADVRIVYSSMDALDIAAKNPESEVVFLGIGFETTAPASAAAINAAAGSGINNFSVFSLHKMVEPVMRVLLNSREVRIDAFMLPGHVAVITGTKGFEFLRQYKMPGVVSGFEPVDILKTIYMIALQVEKGSFEVENEYTRLVSYDGNMGAMDAIHEVFEPCPDIWRGLGLISGSGMKIKEKYKQYDAAAKFGVKLSGPVRVSACRCGDVLKGRIEPSECALFGGGCTPDSPVGPCMVSSEGSCAAAYKYR